MRKTKIRNSLTLLLENSTSPVSVPEILTELKKENAKINKTTIYRDLAMLVREGCVEEVDFGDGKKRYHTFKSPHHHLLCHNCGTVKEVNCEDESLIKKFEDKFKFKIEKHSSEFFGLCINCQ